MTRDNSSTSNPIDRFHQEVGELVFWFAASENVVYLLARDLIADADVYGLTLRNLIRGS